MIRLSGYIALILFIASFYLAVRSPTLNKIFDGLQRQLRWHHWIAMIFVAMMMYHLGQLFWSYRGHFELIFDWSDLALLSGWITFVGVILASLLAFYRLQIPYRRWRRIHILTSLCLITALLHTVLLLAPYNVAEWLIFVSLGILGLIALLLAVILPVFSFWGKKYLISKVCEVRPGLFLLQLQSNEPKHFHFDPGHFMYLKFLSSNLSYIWHPFTIISRPSEPFIELFIKARGKDTGQLNTISLPGSVRVLAPFGTSFWKTDQTQLWIAYGVGAAIFLAAIRSFPSSFRKKIHFICCDSSASKMFFSEELDDCMQQHLNFTWESYIGSGQQFIAEFSGKPFDSTNFEKFRICGHPGFQKNLKSLLISRGVQRHNIKLEGLL
ncbi:Oxidoreductase FAD-binding domain protein [Legionella micdadei]|uniref:Oxidoreductase FAD-binding domain protein n=2 Tax=Legionella micdadei TaxID=451 RepID=A0A098GI40_LEGMI|nr:ferric reductase-like transmembrane domain-containing protein [Legionella micdadei]KTD27440.1 dihydroorotate dehydrogenase electron transfer subunit [Legionella micdadei]CEG62148.1 Oxidoreductase FAD-binding domain protein [Legionella micdadei]SCY73672.1 Predicted ferric reductase [Legionella micdadei]